MISPFPLLMKLFNQEMEALFSLCYFFAFFRRSHRENHRNDREEDFDDRDMEAGWDDVRKEEQRR